MVDLKSVSKLGHGNEITGTIGEKTVNLHANSGLHKGRIAGTIGAVPVELKLISGPQTDGWSICGTLSGKPFSVQHSWGKMSFNGKVEIA